MKTGSKRQTDLPNITEQVNGKAGFLIEAWKIFFLLQNSLSFEISLKPMVNPTSDRNF